MAGKWGPRKSGLQREFGAHIWGPHLGPGLEKFGRQKFGAHVSGGVRRWATRGSAGARHATRCSWQSSGLRWRPAATYALGSAASAAAGLRGIAVAGWGRCPRAVVTFAASQTMAGAVRTAEILCLGTGVAAADAATVHTRPKNWVGGICWC